MNKTLLTAVSALAVAISTPGLAETQNRTEANVVSEANISANESTGSVKKDVKNAWKQTKEDVSNAAEKVSDSVEETYKDAKQAFVDDDTTAELEEITVSERMTAQGIIGRTVYNTNGDRVAKVRDIIVDQNGHATMVILGDGDFTGLGKLVAFDYDLIMTRQADGDVVASITETTIDQAASFSYDDNNTSKATRVIPNNGYSLAKMLDAELVSATGDKLADVENVLMRDGAADQLIISYNEFLGMGGNKLALPFKEAELNETQGEVEFQLSAAETAQFRMHTKASN
ncbi:MAG: hypothetical protein CL561_09685 [Alphaproteobacteria bacterium]|nr:hypothetical protein [Alphaproteobacteria bacterium]|tara:strand:- start:2115 stop:2975 length:861 start_codon:yes stop_codon:yes gene_type:complete